MAVQIEAMAPLLQVFDMRTSVRFYRDVLGLEVIEQSNPGEEFDWCLLKRDNVEIMLNGAYETPYRPPQPDPVRMAHHGDVGLFFGCRDLDEAYTVLRSLGVESSVPAVAPYGMRQIWLKDPDGYTICLQWTA